MTAGSAWTAPPAPQQLSRLMDGYLNTQLLYLAAVLGIADTLAAGPLTAAELGRAVGADPGALHRVLRGLAAEAVLEEHADGRFGLTPAGALLRDGVPGSVRGAVLARGDLYYRAAAGLLDAVRGGGSAFQQVNGREFFDHLADHPSEAAAFQGSMAARSTQEAADVVAVYDFGRFRHLVDVGGGQGILLAAILRAAPALQATLLDEPSVVEQAHPRLAAAGVLDRCRVTGGDFFADVPAGGDCYLLSRVIHDWDDGAAQRILGRCRAAMPADGALLLVEAVLPERAQDQPAAIRMDLHMLTLLSGRERTAAEYEALLASSGFALRRIVSTPPAAGVSVIEAAPAAGR